MFMHITKRHCPHALLLAAAVLGYTLTPSITTPNQPASLAGVTPSTARVIDNTGEHSDTPYSTYDAQQNLADLMNRARAQYQRIEALREKQEKQEEAEEPTAKIQYAKTSQRRMIHREGFKPLPSAPTNTRLHLDYVQAPDPYTWQAPDALPQREYVILQYGEVGSVEPVEAVSTQSQTFIAAAPEPSLDGLLGTVAAGFTASPIAQPEPVSTPELVTTTVTPPLATQTVALSPETVQPRRDAVIEAPASASRESQAVAQTPAARPAITMAQIIQTQTEQAATSQAQAPAQVQPQPVAQQSKPQTERAEETIKPKTPDRSFTTRPTADASVTLPAKPAVETPTTPSTPSTPAVSIKTPITKPPTPEVPAVESLVKNTQSKKNQPLVVLVDDSDTLGQGRLSAIDNALKQINQAVKKTKIDIELSLTTDKSVGHSILLREEDNDQLDGKLGLARSAAITDDQGIERRIGQDATHLGGQAIASLNKSINWFTGSNADDIGKNQYDYQTAVTHELLHLLGLDDEFDSMNDDNVMFGYLGMGETRRTIAEAERYDLESLYSHGSLWRQSSYTSYSSRFNSYSKYANSWPSRGVRYRYEALTAAPVPEPASMALIGVGLFGVWMRRKR